MPKESRSSLHPPAGGAGAGPGPGTPALALQLDLYGRLRGHPRVCDDALHGVAAQYPRREGRELNPEGVAGGLLGRLHVRLRA